ncbi:hypothetical protein Trydic_g3776 [Trypoxylus dichotomus]
MLAYVTPKGHIHRGPVKRNEEPLLSICDTKDHAICSRTASIGRAEVSRADVSRTVAKKTPSCTGLSLMIDFRGR